MGTPLANGVWKKALAKWVLVTTAVIMSNYVDPQVAVLSWVWFRHLLVVIAFTTIFTEAQYFHDWAQSVLYGNGNGNGGGNGKTQTGPQDPNKV